jgi:hypothetical protein
MTSAPSAIRLTVRTHHDADAVELDRLRLMGRYSRQHSVVCDCQRCDDLDPEDCGGLSVYNAAGGQCASYRGNQYRALQNYDGSLSIFSTQVRN